MKFRDLVLGVEDLSDGAIESSSVALAASGDGGELPTYVSHMTLEDDAGNGREYMLILAPTASAPGRARDMLLEGEMDSMTLARGVRVVVPDGRVGVISGPGAKAGEWTVTLDDFEGTMGVRRGDVRLETQEDVEAREKKRKK